MSTDARKLLARLPAMTRTHWTVLAVVWTVAVFIGCALPGDQLPDHGLFSEDKLLHIVAFAGIAFLWLRAGRRVGRILWAGLAFGVFIEVFQRVTPFGRFFDPFDVMADGLGLLVGVALHAALVRLFPPG